MSTGMKTETICSIINHLIVSGYSCYAVPVAAKRRWYLSRRDSAFLSYRTQHYQGILYNIHRTLIGRGVHLLLQGHALQEAFHGYTTPQVPLSKARFTKTTAEYDDERVLVSATPSHAYNMVPHVLWHHWPLICHASAQKTHTDLLESVSISFGYCLSRLALQIEQHTQHPQVVLNLWLHVLMTLDSYGPHRREGQLTLNETQFMLQAMLRSTVSLLTLHTQEKPFAFLIEMQRLLFEHRDRTDRNITMMYTLQHMLWGLIEEELEQHLEDIRSRVLCANPLESDVTKAKVFVKDTLAEQLLPLCVSFVMSQIDPKIGLSQTHCLNTLRSVAFLGDIFKQMPSTTGSATNTQYSVEANRLRLDCVQRVMRLLCKLLNSLLRMPLSDVTLDTLRDGLWILEAIENTQTNEMHRKDLAVERDFTMATSGEEGKNRISMTLYEQCGDELLEMYGRLVDLVDLKYIPASTRHSAVLCLIAWRRYFEVLGGESMKKGTVDRLLLYLFSGLLDYKSKKPEFYTHLFDTLLVFYNEEAVHQVINARVRRLTNAVLSASGYEARQWEQQVFDRFLMTFQKLRLRAGSYISSLVHMDVLLNKEYNDFFFFNFMNTTSTSITHQLRILENITQSLGDAFPIDLFEKEGGGALLSAILCLKTKHFVERVQRPLSEICVAADPSSCTSTFSKQAACQANLTLGTLANVAIHLPKTSTASPWVLFAWRQSILLQQSITEVLKQNRMIPQPIPSHGALNSPLSSLSQPPHPNTPSPQVPPSFLYYTSKRLQINIEQLCKSCTIGALGSYAGGIIPLYVKGRDTHYDYLSRAMAGNNKSSKDNILGSLLSVDDVSLPLKPKTRDKLQNRDEVPVDVVLLHGLRGSALKTWKWVQYEPWAYTVYGSKHAKAGKHKTDRQGMWEDVCSSPSQIAASLNQVPPALSFYREIKGHDGNEPKTAYSIQVEEPGVENAWYFHWPQLFLPDVLPKLSRILAVHLEVPVTKQRCTLKRKTSEPPSNLKSFMNNLSFRPLRDTSFRGPYSKPPLFTCGETSGLMSPVHGPLEETTPAPAARHVPLTSTDMSLPQLAELVKSRLEYSKIVDHHQNTCDSNTPHRHIVWITHSMGGLILKYLLLNDARFAKSTRAVVFVGVPHFGSPLSQAFGYLKAFFPLYCQELHPHRYHHRLHVLNEQFRQLCLQHNIVVVSFGETLETPLPYVSQLSSRYKHHIVPPHFANPNYGWFYLLPQVDHTKVCYVSRPDDRISLLGHLIRASSRRNTTACQSST